MPEPTQFAKPFWSLFARLVPAVYIASLAFFPTIDKLYDPRFSGPGIRAVVMIIMAVWFFAVAVGWSVLLIVPLLSSYSMAKRAVLALALPFFGWSLLMYGSQALVGGPSWAQVKEATAMFSSGVIGAVCVGLGIRFNGNWNLLHNSEDQVSAKPFSIAEILLVTAIISILLAAIRFGIPAASMSDALFPLGTSALVGVVSIIPALCGLALTCGSCSNRAKVTTAVLFIVSIGAALTFTMIMFTNGEFSISRLQTLGMFVPWIVSSLLSVAAIYGLGFASGFLIKRSGFRLVNRLDEAVAIIDSEIQ